LKIEQYFQDSFEIFHYLFMPAK